MKRAGVLITLKSGDPGLFENGTLDNIYLCFAESANLSVEEIADFARNSFNASWLDDETKARHIQDLHFSIRRWAPETEPSA